MRDMSAGASHSSSPYLDIVIMMLEQAVHSDEVALKILASDADHSSKANLAPGIGGTLDVSARSFGRQKKSWALPVSFLFDYAAGVIQPIPAPPGCVSIAMRPIFGISKIGRINWAPAATAFSTRDPTSSTAR